MTVNNFDISKTEREFQQFLDRLPRTAGTIAVNFSKQRFKEGGWRGGNFIPWRPRKKSAKRNKGRAVLIDKGALRASIRLQNTTSTSATIAVTGAAQKYAKAHNEGVEKTVNIKAHTRRKFGRAQASSVKTRRTNIQKYTANKYRVEAHSRKMNIPKRQFIGKSKTLERQLINHIDNEIKKIFK